MKDKKFYVIYEAYQDYSGYWEMECKEFKTKEGAEAEAKILSNRQLYTNIKILTDI